MKAKIRYDRYYEVGDVTRRMAGSFVEHLNRCMYGGLCDPGHSSADSAGFRGDVKKLIRDYGISLLRYPGGNFVSAYNWKDGIGPVEKRPVRYDLAWGAYETNRVGTDEFARYAREIGAELMMSVNLGTGTPREAAELVEYCNVERGTFYSDLRRKNGSEQPYGIRLWCVGNEMDGPWQMGQMDADAYAKKYLETARMMRSVDPDISLVACGSCSNEPVHGSFGIWDRIVLEAAYEQIDYLSLHRYYGYDIEQKLLYPRTETLGDVPWMAEDLDEFIRTISAAITYVRGIRRSAHQVFLSFDELGILPHRGKDCSGRECDAYSQYDAVLYGGLLCVLLNHADMVRIHCQSLVVNENGLFLTFPQGDAIVQTIAGPFRDLADCVGGTVLRQSGEWPKIGTDHFGPAQCASSACVYDKEAGELKVLAANYSLDQELALTLEFGGFGKILPDVHLELYSENPHDRRPGADSSGIHPARRELKSTENILLRPHSWNILKFKTDTGNF